MGRRPRNAFIWDDHPSRSANEEPELGRPYAGSAVVATPDSGENRGFDLMPAVDHLVVAEAEHQVVECAQFRVAAPVRLETDGVDVVRSTVDLDDESATDEKVDPFTVDPHLPLNGEMVLRETNPRDGLRPAFADSVRQLEEASATYAAVDQDLPLPWGDQRWSPEVTPAKCGVGNGDCVLDRLAADDLGEARDGIE